MSIIQYEQRIVAFIDILGFKAIIDETELPNNQDKINNIKEAFDLIGDLLKQHYHPDQIQQVKYSTFSDCIVFSFPVRQTNNLFFSLIPLIWLQAILVWQHNILLRGALTIGEIYHDENMVFGPAMVEAYELESKVAEFPRIILHDKIEADYEQWLAEVRATDDQERIYDLENEKNYTFKPKGLLTKDNDGHYYVDYLEKFAGDNPENYVNFIAHIESFIEPYLKPDTAPSILKKYIWLYEKIQKIKTQMSSS